MLQYGDRNLNNDVFLFYCRSSNWQGFKRFPCQNFPYIPYLPHYVDVIRCESFESTEFIPRIRLMFKVFSVAVYCCWLAPYTLCIQTRCATQHQYWLLTCCCITLCGTGEPVVGEGGGCSLCNRRFHFVCNILISSFSERKKKKMGLVGYGRLYFEDSVATRGAFRSFQIETR